LTHFWRTADFVGTAFKTEKADRRNGWILCRRPWSVVTVAAIPGGEVACGVVRTTLVFEE
jgi:hypothetical protein